MTNFGNCALVANHAGGVSAVRFSADGATVYSAGADGAVRATSVASPGDSRIVVQYHAHVDPEYGEPVLHHPLALDVRHGLLAVGLKHGVVEVYAADSGSRVATLANPPLGSAYTRDFYAIALHPGDSKRVLGSNGSFLCEWDLGSGSLAWRESGFRGINSIALLRDGSRLMAMEWDPWLHLFELPGHGRLRWETDWIDQTWNLVTSRAAPRNSPFEFAISALEADGGILVATTLDPAGPTWTMQTSDRVHDMAFCLDQKHLLAGNDDGTIDLWDLGSQAPPVSINVAALPNVAAMVGSPGKARGLIFTRPTLGEAGDLPPSAVHTIDVSPTQNLAAAGLVGGAVVLVELNP